MEPEQGINDPWMVIIDANVLIGSSVTLRVSFTWIISRNSCEIVDQFSGVGEPEISEQVIESWLVTWVWLFRRKKLCGARSLQPTYHHILTLLWGLSSEYFRRHRLVKLAKNHCNTQSDQITDHYFIKLIESEQIRNLDEASDVHSSLDFHTWILELNSWPHCQTNLLYGTIISQSLCLCLPR